MKKTTITVPQVEASWNCSRWGPVVLESFSFHVTIESRSKRGRWANSSRCRLSRVSSKLSVKLATDARSHRRKMSSRQWFVLHSLSRLYQRYIERAQQDLLSSLQLLHLDRTGRLEAGSLHQSRAFSSVIAWKRLIIKQRTNVQARECRIGVRPAALIPTATYPRSSSPRTPAFHVSELCAFVDFVAGTRRAHGRTGARVYLRSIGRAETPPAVYMHPRARDGWRHDEIIPVAKSGSPTSLTVRERRTRTRRFAASESNSPRLLEQCAP